LNPCILSQLALCDVSGRGYSILPRVPPRLNPSCLELSDTL
jgi:hypothetical protein